MKNKKRNIIKEIAWFFLNFGYIKISKIFKVKKDLYIDASLLFFILIYNLTKIEMR